MTSPMIRADYLIFALRAELSEQRFARNLATVDPNVTDLERASHAGFIEALEWALEEVEKRAKKAAA